MSPTNILNRASLSEDRTRVVMQAHGINAGKHNLLVALYYMVSAGYVLHLLVPELALLCCNIVLPGGYVTCRRGFIS